MMFHKGRLRQRGHGLISHRGRLTQRGYGLITHRGDGLGSIFGSLFRNVLRPAAKAAAKLGKKAITSNTGKNLIKESKKFAKEAAISSTADLLSGKSIGDTASSRLEEAKNKIGSSLEAFQKSQDTVKRPKRRKRPIITSTGKRIRGDIFD